jgi:transcriptional regulator HMO1
MQLAQNPMMLPPININFGPVDKKKGKGKGNIITFQSMTPGSGDGDLGDGKKRKRATKEKKVKDPNAPKRPPSAYLLYQNEFRKEIKEKNPDMTYPQVLQEISKMWSALSPEDKKPYQDATDLAKVEFEKAKTEYLEAHPAGGDVTLQPTDDASESSGDSPVLPKSTSSVGLLVDEIAKNEAKRKRKEAAARAKAAAAAAAPRPPPAAPSESLGSDDDKNEEEDDEEEEEEIVVKPPPRKRAKKAKTPPPSPGKGRKDKKRK